MLMSQLSAVSVVHSIASVFVVALLCEGSGRRDESRVKLDS